MSNWSNLAARVNAAQLRAFGEAVNYYAGGGSAAPVEMDVVWTDEPLSVWVREADLVGVRLEIKDLFMRGSSTYRVIEPLPRAIEGGLTILLRQTGGAHANT